MLAQRLYQLRQQKNMTHQQMADLLGITRPAYTAYESGTRKPEYDKLEKLADFFQVSIDYLLGRKSESPSPLVSNYQNAAIFNGKEVKLTEEEAEYLKISLEVFRRYKGKKG